jgi:hypothetical protein
LADARALIPRAEHTLMARRLPCPRQANPMTNPLARPLDLPCGATLCNRLAKAAMSEGLA